MEKMGIASSELDELFRQKKRVKNPLLFWDLKLGRNSNLGQKLMRTRVVAQGATVALMVGTAYYYGENSTRKNT
ncbi:hypothetical protein MKX01_021836 [Papaver californicum]|nr:hypothetical protein MKX01_021836 [Papaver californicum]